jgi:hypothetical protein
MGYGRSFAGLFAACLMLAGCNGRSKNKPDLTKGVVTGVVICSDTGKPARFAHVTLTAVPEKDSKARGNEQNGADEESVTDLDGRFRIEAVPPGRYVAFATLDGYLDPMLGVDLKAVLSKPTEDEKSLAAIEQWKDHLVEVAVAVHRVTEVPITIERGAGIEGAVSFDDGSPAIGMRFQLERKNTKGELADVGVRLFNDWTLPKTSDGHGHYSLTNLPAGEYVVCALLPWEDEEASPRICLGDTFRQKLAKTVKVTAGETADGVDIVIPLDKLHKVEGKVSVLRDGHAPGSAKVQLLFADDRQVALEAQADRDGSFEFAYVPEDKYVLLVTNAEDVADPNSTPPKKAHPYADKEEPMVVLGDLSGVQIVLPEVTPPSLAAQQ